MATDALGLGMALAAIQAASKARTHPQRTFGLYRLEILTALVNAALFGVAGYVLFEAISRLSDSPDVASTPVLIVGIIGLIVNVIASLLLRAGSKESLNLQGAYIEVLSDMLGSVGVIVAAIVWGITGWSWVDPIIGAAISVFILPRAWKLGRGPCAFWCRLHRRGLISPRCKRSWPGSLVSSMFTIYTCGR